MIDVAALTGPLGPDRPCGDNLEYDADFQALEVAARGRPEQQFGGKDARVIPGEEPSWAEVRERALALFGRTRDLRVAVLLARALTRTDGIAGFAAGVAVLLGLVEGLWDNVHPQLDPDDDHDPVMRVNALAALADAGGMLRDLRAAEFLSDARVGRCTVRQVEIVLGLVDRVGDEPAMPRPQIEGLLREAVAAGMPNHAGAALAGLQRLAAALDERVGVARAPDLKPLLARVRPIAAFVKEAAPAADIGEPAAAGTAADEPPQENAMHAPAPAPSGEIRNRQDVVDLLGRICDYLERNEPTNPAPLLIRRAQRLMTMNFVDILRDVAPEGVAAISRIAGLPETK